MDKLIEIGIKETKKMMKPERIINTLSATENIMKYDDVFIPMLKYIVKPLSDSEIRKIWFERGEAILNSCNMEHQPFHNQGREGVEIYLEKVIFEHFECWGFSDKRTKNG